MPDIRPPIRHLPAPDSLGERVKRLRFTLARRAVQFSILALFIGTAHLG